MKDHLEVDICRVMQSIIPDNQFLKDCRHTESPHKWHRIVPSFHASSHTYSTSVAINPRFALIQLHQTYSLFSTFLHPFSTQLLQSIS